MKIIGSTDDGRLLVDNGVGQAEIMPSDWIPPEIVTWLGRHLVDKIVVKACVAGDGFVSLYLRDLDGQPFHMVIHPSSRAAIVSGPLEDAE